MAVDSAAAFKERYCDETMQLGAHVKRFEDAGWSTYADLVFSTTFTLHNGEEERYKADILMVGLGDLNHKDRTKLRRLFFEAYTLVGAQMKRSVESPAGGAPREIPNPELEARRERTEARVSGLKLLDDLDISDRLLIRAIEMYDSGKMGYLGLDLCTKRGDAMVGIHRDQQWESAPNVTGGFTIRRADDGQRADIDGQFAFSYALQRRSLALDMGDVLAFDNHETLRLKFISVLMSSPPPGFLPVGFDQILDSDRCFWIEMGKLTRKGIKRKPDGRPCDKVFEEVFKNFTFNMMLMPKQGVSRAAPPPAAPIRPTPRQQTVAQSPGIGKKAMKRDRQAQAAAKAKDQGHADAIAQAFKKPKTDGRPGGSRDGAKGSGRDDNRTPRLPAKLIGMCTVSSKETGSKRFCYAYNMAECAGAGPGAACSKGLHACMRPLPSGEACSAAHSTFSCKL